MYMNNLNGLTIKDLGISTSLNQSCSCYDSLSETFIQDHLSKHLESEPCPSPIVVNYPFVNDKNMHHVVLY